MLIRGSQPTVPAVLTEASHAALGIQGGILTSQTVSDDKSRVAVESLSVVAGLVAAAFCMLWD